MKSAVRSGDQQSADSVFLTPVNSLLGSFVFKENLFCGLFLALLCAVVLDAPAFFSVAVFVRKRLYCSVLSGQQCSLQLLWFPAGRSVL